VLGGAEGIGWAFPTGNCAVPLNERWLREAGASVCSGRCTWVRGDGETLCGGRNWRARARSRVAEWRYRMQVGGVDLVPQETGLGMS
jgi:hypothetical protein